MDNTYFHETPVFSQMSVSVCIVHVLYVFVPESAKLNCWVYCDDDAFIVTHRHKGCDDDDTFDGDFDSWLI